MSPNDSLLEIYAEVERRLADEGYVCRACGECCNFRANDYVLYASQIETDLVLEKTGRRPELVNGRCCFQDDAGRCTIHPWRPLGCRTYFCRQARPAVGCARASQELHERSLKRIGKLTQDLGREWRYHPFFSWGAE